MKKKTRESIEMGTGTLLIVLFVLWLMIFYTRDDWGFSGWDRMAQAHRLRHPKPEDPEWLPGGVKYEAEMVRGAAEMRDIERMFQRDIDNYLDALARQRAKEAKELQEWKDKEDYKAKLARELKKIPATGPQINIIIEKEKEL